MYPSTDLHVEEIIFHSNRKNSQVFRSRCPRKWIGKIDSGGHDRRQKKKRKIANYIYRSDRATYQQDSTAVNKNDVFENYYGLTYVDNNKNCASFW